jgi:hypothetical protein
MKTVLNSALATLALALVACGNQNSGSDTQAPAKKPVAKPSVAKPNPLNLNEATLKNCPNAKGKQTSDPYKPRYLTLCEWIYANDVTPRENLTIRRMIESASQYGNTGDGSTANIIRVLEEKADTFGFESAGISEVGPIATLPNLTAFTATGNFIHDLRPLRHLKKLNWILIGSNTPEKTPSHMECPIQGRPGAECIL